MSGALMARSMTAEAGMGQPEFGLRERKKARLRQQIIDTSLKLFRKQGYEATRIDDIVQVLEISQPTFFRYFPAKMRFYARSESAAMPASATGCVRSFRARAIRTSACVGST